MRTWSGALTVGLEGGTGKLARSRSLPRADTHSLQARQGVLARTRIGRRYVSFSPASRAVGGTAVQATQVMLLRDNSPSTRMRPLVSYLWCSVC